MSRPAKILTLSVVGSVPETAVELHKQIREEIEPSAELQDIETQLTELATENFIQSAEKWTARLSIGGKGTYE